MKYFTILLISLSIYLYADKIYAPDELIIQKETYYEKTTGVLANGIQKKYNKSDGSYTETPYKNGKSNGIVKIYAESGVLSGEAPYKNGLEDGVMKFYTSSGGLKLEAPYKNGKEHGIKKAYFDSGALLYEKSYKNGKQHGSEKYYSESGDLLIDKIYVDGKEKKPDLTQEIIKRCRSQMGEYGSTMVKACVDQDIEAEKALNRY